MTFLTTVTVFNGLPGYCYMDDEHFYTDEYPTKCELEQFENEACRGKMHVRNTRAQIEMVKVDVPETQEPHEGALKDSQQTTLEPAQP